ncbi:hypothetical protein GCM10027271_43030 [Saccharopolyspora gloriosae]|uniref:Uncharacterized protein n=1 Tax=Saccharopolyspora gloriosae TaxID=455344 RepID=A0A840NM92_9PSEU|nr:hypothetical protein [Saccharopolyspora gloriosae]MBB5070399.1 hypothetical protein [Saccharopolyspora gloriosae]
MITQTCDLRQPVEMTSPPRRFAQSCSFRCETLAGMSEVVLSSEIVAPPGGVMTDEVGVITGDLELRTTCTPDGSLTVEVRYAGADEWYRIPTAEVQLHDPADHKAAHHILTGVLHRPEG